MAKFVLSAADGTEYPIGETITQIGRESSCQIMLADPLVSRIHATLWAEGDALFVRDEYSSNGAYVNEDAISPAQPRRLAVGDQLRVGNTTFTVAYARVTGSLPSAPPRPPLRSAAEQTDVGFSFKAPSPARPTVSILRQRFNPLLLMVFGVWVFLVAVVLLVSCAALIWFATR
jgi:predicted component of type VI protein secretion system